MGTKEKRHARIKNNPANVRFDEAVAWLLAFGFIQREGRGSHVAFTHPLWDGKLTMQNLKGKAKAYQIRQALKAIEEVHHV